MDRRRQPRVTAAFTVRIWGIDAKALPFTQHARVTNISGRGAVIDGMVRPVKPGEILQVQLGKESARFRVVWAGKPRSRRQCQIGVESLPSEPYIWDVNLAHCGVSAGKG